MSEPTVGQLVSRITNDFTRLIRLELELFKVETKVEAKKAGKAAGLLGGAGFAGHLAILFASLALMFLLDLWMPLPCAALAVAVLWGVVAAVLGKKGKERLDTVDPVPHQTIESVQGLTNRPVDRTYVNL